MNKRFWLVLAIVGTAFVGCDKKAEEAAKTENGETKLADDDVSVVGDFVEEAETTITPANYKTELDRLEGEIEKE